MLPSETQAIQEEGDGEENNSQTRSESTQIYNELPDCNIASNGTDTVLTSTDSLMAAAPNDQPEDTSPGDQRQRILSWPVDSSNATLTRSDGPTLALSPEGGVIVLGKMQPDGTVSALLPRDDCQDVILMVELKYNKDIALPDVQTSQVLPQIHRDGTLKQQTIKARIINYVTETDVARSATKGSQPIDSHTAFQTDDSGLTIAKTNLLTYDADGNPQNTCIAYPTSHSISLSKEALSYIPDGQALAAAQTVTFEDSSQVSLTKEQALSLMAGSGMLPNAQIISFAPDPGPGVNSLTRTHLVSYTNDTQSPEFVNNTVVVDSQLADLVYESESVATVQAPKTNPKSNSEKPFPCPVCQKRFMRRTNLRSHMAHHNEERPYICDTCGKSFALRWDLTLHNRLHTGVYSCEVCGKAFAVPGKLERHRRIHSGERPFSCLVCGKAFSDKHNLEAHVRTHSDQRPFSCQTCGNTFRSRSHLRAHRRVHTEDTPFTCHLCGKSFKWKANLNLHLKGHSGSRYKCEGCGREFARPADLVRHRRSHEGLRPHECTLCSRTYVDRGALNKHMKSHTEHRPYICDVCNKGFHYQWYLTAHKKIHEAGIIEKRFHCPHCDKEYCKKSTLNSHLKTHVRDTSVVKTTDAPAGETAETTTTVLTPVPIDPITAIDPVTSPAVPMSTPVNLTGTHADLADTPIDPAITPVELVSSSVDTAGTTVHEGPMDSDDLMISSETVYLKESNMEIFKQEISDPLISGDSVGLDDSNPAVSLVEDNGNESNSLTDVDSHAETLNTSMDVTQT